MFAFKLKSRQAAAVAWIILLITIPATFIYFVRCPSSQVAGISVPYADGYVQYIHMNNVMIFIYLLVPRVEKTVVRVQWHAIVSLLLMHQSVEQTD